MTAPMRIPAWRNGAERAEGSEAWATGAADLDHELRRVASVVEEGLHDIDFEEVTAEDRATFVEAVIAWQVRRALRAGRLSVAVALRRFGADRIARILG